MSTYRKNLKDFTAQEIDDIRYWSNKYAEVLLNPPSGFVEGLPFVGKLINSYQHAKYLEAAYFFLKTNDPVLDQKMLNAFKIKAYELHFAFWTGLAWGGFFAVLPGWKGYGWHTRLAAGTIPFLLVMYRGFKRGYEQISYVGEPFMEHHLKKKALLKYLRDNDDMLIDFKEALLRSGTFNRWLMDYGLEPLSETTK